MLLLIARLAAVTALSALAACGGDARAAKAVQKRPAVLTGKATVVDGDGLEIGGVRIRLFGVDALEADQYCDRPDATRWRCGHYASVALDRLVAGKTVSCTERARDRYQRPVSVCTVEGRDVGGELAREGWALAYRRYSTDYVDEEDAAKQVGAGVWAGRFEPPWAYRARTRNHETGG